MSTDALNPLKKNVILVTLLYEFRYIYSLENFNAHD